MTTGEWKLPVPQGRKYAQTHEWFKVDGNTVTAGSSQSAADEFTGVFHIFDRPRTNRAFEECVALRSPPTQHL